MVASFQGITFTNKDSFNPDDVNLLSKIEYGIPVKHLTFRLNITSLIMISLIYPEIMIQTIGDSDNNFTLVC